MRKFEVGHKYQCKSICNSDTTWECEIERRTEKSVWANGKRFSIKTYEDTEIIYPEGKYSMCQVLKAENEIKH